MDWKDAAQHWPALAGAASTRWPELDQDDIAAVDGRHDALRSLLVEKLEITPSEADEEIAALVAGPLPSDAVTDPSEDNTQIQKSAAHIPTGEDVYSEDRDFGDDRLDTRPLGRTGND